MKRCPKCNRVETVEALKFCRVDGATLFKHSSSIGSEAGTAQLGASADAGEVHTSILPHRTDANIDCPTAPTTVLPPQPASSTTNELRITQKSRLNKTAIALIVTAIVAAVTAVVVISYRSGNRRTTINSIAVMPFVNENGNADADYLSDGMTETLIRSLSQLPNLNVKSRASVFRYKGRNADAKTIGKE